ncbi:DUF91 domain-containing protein [bacterium]|nr:DUF91 domain-containing protein [bacterium]
MEDAIVNDPEKYLNEVGLKLLARQFRIGTYIFDLLFEDRHGGKLIVELQKGTLDRTHTYKILDYYHEYKEKNPRDFIDVMVIANVIPPERKRRLSDLAIDYREIPVGAILDFCVEIPNITPFEIQSVTLRNKRMGKLEKSENDQRGSAFISVIRRELNRIVDTNIWTIGGKDACLTVRHLRTEKNLKEKFTPQIWIARPDIKGNVRCSFELANNQEEEIERKEIASKIRSFISRDILQAGIKESRGSTIVYLPIQLSRISEDDDVNESIDEKEISKIIKFYEFLNGKLFEWNELELINQKT